MPQIERLERITAGRDYLRRNFYAVVGKILYVDTCLSSAAGLDKVQPASLDKLFGNVVFEISRLMATFVVPSIDHRNLFHSRLEGGLKVFDFLIPACLPSTKQPKMLPRPSPQ